MKMETKYELKVTASKSEGKTVGYVKIKTDLCWVTFRLDKSNGKFFLNPPATFVDSLKGTDTNSGGKHSGWVENAGLSKAAAAEIKARALEELGFKEEPAAA
jgi:hypothetical protein